MTDLTLYGGGTVGPSAYDVYVQSATDAGQTVLSQEAWLASLVGPEPWTFDVANPDWLPTTPYAARAAVRHSGAFWLSIVQNAGVTPGTNQEIWVKLLDGIDIALYDSLLAEVETARDAAAASEAAAAAAEIGAQAARDAAATDAQIYASTAAGLAATVETDQFSVVSGEEIIRYRHDAGPIATELARYPTYNMVLTPVKNLQSVGAVGDAWTATSLRDIPVEATFYFQAPATNAGPVTLTVTTPSGDVVMSLRNNAGTELSAGDVTSGHIYQARRAAAFANIIALNHSRTNALLAQVTDLDTQVGVFSRAGASASAETAFIRVDRGRSLITFPPLSIVVGATTYATATTSLALATTATANVYYYDVATNTVKFDAGDFTNARWSANAVPLGIAINGIFWPEIKVPVRYISDERQNIRVAIGSDLDAPEVVVDRVAGTVFFPALAWRGPGVTVGTVRPVGWSGDPTLGWTLPLSTDYATKTYYYFDNIAQEIGSTTDPSSPVPGEYLHYIGFSNNFSFQSDYGLRVRYLQQDHLPRGRMSREGVARHMQAPGIRSGYGSRQPVIYSGTAAQGWYAVQPLFCDDHLSITAGGKIDLEHIPVGTCLHVSFNAGCEIWAGRGKTFLGSGGHNRAVLTGQGMCEVVRGTSIVTIKPIVGTPVYDTITEPVRTRSILLAGQSQRQLYGEYCGIGGFMRAIKDTTWVQSAITEDIAWIKGATGGSAIDQRSGAVSYWWDWTLNAGEGGPGPALTACINAIATNTAAGQPAPDAVLWTQGESDAAALQAGTFTVTDMTATIKAVWAYIRANGAPAATFIVSTLGTHDYSADRGYTGARLAYLQAIEDEIFAYHGSDYYDMPRGMGEVHLYDSAYSAWGRRDALVWANLIHGQTNDLGPQISGMAVDAGKKKVTLSRTYAGSLYQPHGDQDDKIASGPQPFGFGAVLASNPTAEPIPLVRGYSDGASLVLECDQSLVGYRIVYPVGCFAEARDGAIVRDYRLDSYHGVPGLPLRSWVSDVIA